MAFAKILGASVLTAVVTLALASVLSGQQARLADRVDRNAQIAAQESLRTRQLICAIAAENTALNQQAVRDICAAAAIAIAQP